MPVNNDVFTRIHYNFTACTQRLREGHIFKPVCLFTRGGGGGLLPGPVLADPVQVLSGGGGVD